MGHLIDLQPVGDRRPADAALGGEPGNVEQPAALPQQQFQHAQKPGALLQPEQLLHVPREIGIQPFGVKLGVVLLREQGGRQPAAQQPLPHVRDAEGGQLLVEHGTSSTTRLRPVRLSRNFCVAARVEEPVARMRNRGNASAPILSSRLGSGSWWTSSRTTVGWRTER